MIRSSLLKPAVLLLTLSTLLPVQAQPPDKDGDKKDKKEEKEKKDDGKKEDAAPLVEVAHEMTIRGQKVAYKSIAGSLTLTKAYGEPRADVFHIAYTRTDLDAETMAKR